MNFESWGSGVTASRSGPRCFAAAACDSPCIARAPLAYLTQGMPRVRSFASGPTPDPRFVSVW